MKSRKKDLQTQRTSENPIQARNRGFGRSRGHLKLTRPPPRLRSELFTYKTEVQLLGTDDGLGRDDRRFSSGATS
jgi:hypothetical protein